MQIIHFDEITSTNEYLMKNHAILDDFAVVYADYQTNGKGREDRTWYANKGDNLLFSILIKDQKNIGKFNAISMIMALSVLEVLESLNISNVSIKWPNDVYVGDKKICGILLQGRLPQFIVIGTGLNVNQKNFEGSYRISPTSIFNEIGTRIDIDSILKRVLDKFSFNISQNPDDILKKINNKNYLLNKNVKFVKDNQIYEGIASLINNNFELIVKSNGKIYTINSGEITH